MRSSLDGIQWGFCVDCKTMVERAYEVSLIRGQWSGWVLLPHRWEGRLNCRYRCGTRQPYNHKVATGHRLNWQRGMVAQDLAITRFVMNADNEQLTRSKVG